MDDEWNNEAAQEAYEAGMEAAQAVVDAWKQKAATFGSYEEQFWEGVSEFLY